MSAASALDFAHRNRARFLAELEQLLSIPSISTLPDHRPDMVRAAEWLSNHLNAVGVTAEVIQGDGHPLVYGEWLGAPGAPTILVYGHYDVQPVDPLGLWRTPPFRPALRDGNLYARGASDDKGQTMTMINAAECLLRTAGKLPVNVKFLLEGEEEAGGATIAAYVRDNPDRLRADIVQIADSSMFAPGIPTIETGLRGTVYTEVHARGAAHDLHSGLYGGVAPNPLNALGHVIAGLKDPAGRITIPEFYDDVQMPPEDVLESWRQLPFDEGKLRDHEIGSSELAGETAYSPLERRWARPTLDVHGIVGGFVDEGAKTVIPAVAVAKISMRIVPNQRCDRVFELFQQHVLELASPGIELDVQLLHGGDPVVVPTDNPFVEAAGSALEATFGRAPVFGRSGGSIPIVGAFKELLGLNTVLMGWGLPDDNLHAPNEKLLLENFYAGTDATIRFWEQAAGRPGA